jgi:hypothetical protein
MTPFQVSISYTVAGMTRFVQAMARTGAKVTASPTTAQTGDTLTFIVWLKPMTFGIFQAWCKPVGFQFVPAEVIKVDGTMDPKATTPGRP